MATTQWIPPLPPGYEARWDPNQRAYFFINHTDKTTTWQDPRFHAAPAQHNVAAQYLNTHAGGQGVAGQDVQMNTMYKQFGSTTSTGDYSDDEDWESEDIDIPFRGHGKKVDLQKVHQLKQMHPSANESLIKTYLQRNDNNLGMTSSQLVIAGFKKVEPTSHPPPRGVDMIERLRAMYPSANPGLVQDILHQCQYNEKNTRAQLESIGYRPVFGATANQGSGQAKSQPKQKSPSPKKSPTPTKPSLTEAQKRDLERKMKGRFSHMEASVITMALQVCDYDENRIEMLLKSMKDEPGGGSGSRPGTSSTSRTRSRSPSPKPVSPVNLEPASFSYDFDIGSVPSSRPGTSKSSTSRPSTSKSGTRVASPKKKTTAPSSGQKQQQQQRAKQVTQLSEDVLSSTIDMLNHLATNVSCCRTSGSEDAQQDRRTRTPAQSVVSRQPGEYVSPYRTTAKGPDPSLRVGPNKDILLTDYIVVKGPNPELRQGPDAERVCGPQGSVGPDRSLHSGPQFHLRIGPNSGGPTVTEI